MALRVQPPLAKFREGGMSTIKGCEVFAKGVHRGKEYSDRDLDQMVENFNRFSRPGSNGRPPLLRVPAVLGHEENQELLENSSLPAAAWGARAYRDGPVVRFDFEDVPPPVARLIRGKRYRTVSAEIYDEPPEGVPGHGKMFRRIAFLGGEIPQVKSLADIPMPEAHAERDRPTPIFLRLTKVRPHKSLRGVFSCFSEIVPMNRDQLIAELAKCGVDTSVITDAVPDPLLAEWLRSKTSEDSTDDEGDLPEVQDQAEREKLAEKGKKMAERGKAMCDKYGAKCHADDGGGSGSGNLDAQGNAMSDFGNSVGSQGGKAMGEPPAGSPPAKAPEQEAAAGGQVPKKESHVIEYHKELDAKVKAVEAKIDTLNKYAEARLASEKRSRITNELDALVKSGHVLPAERDGGLDDLLFAQDATTVMKFSEKGKTVERTPLDQMIHALKARPLIGKFAERMKDPATDPKAAEDEEVGKVEAHFESFKEHFPKTVTKQSLVDGFKAAKKSNPDLKADDFLHV